MSVRRYSFAVITALVIFASAAAPALACLLMPSAAAPHGCCAPAAAVQKDCAPGFQTCCVTEQRQQDSVVTARYDGRQPAPAALPVAVLAPEITLGASPVFVTSDTSPPGASPGLASILRI